MQASETVQYMVKIEVTDDRVRRVRMSPRNKNSEKFSNYETDYHVANGIHRIKFSFPVGQAEELKRAYLRMINRMYYCKHVSFRLVKQ